jgi:hypothetical protein
MHPKHVRPDQMPDPWLLDTQALLKELDRVRELAVRIPPIRNELIGPINSVIDAVWDLQQRLRFCLANRSEAHSETQRAFREAAATKSPKRQTKPIDRQAEAWPANARRKA